MTSEWRMCIRIARFKLAYTARLKTEAGLDHLW
jgi:hypothetical protein